MRAVVRTTRVTTAVAAAAVSAAPTNAPSRLVGTADCGSDGSFSFVGNSGNAYGTTCSRHSSPLATASAGCSTRAAST
jgi:hypothetical protein